MSNIIQDIDIVDRNSQEAMETVKTSKEENTGKAKKLYIESYGCQMNFADSEIVTSIMKENGYDTTSDFENADVVFLNTCSIREKAEQTVRNRLNHFNAVKKSKPNMTIGVLGCMAERLKDKLLEEEKIVDVVVGPDAYRDLPKLVESAEDGLKAVNTFLSREETYADISPVRLNSNGVTAFISIMRGCDNMCSFCVVPFTRGRERSRDPHSIVQEAQDLFNQGYREVTLLGQNVDSYKWSPNENNKAWLEKKEKKGEKVEVINFANLLEMVAKVSPDLRVRFSTSHPKDITDEVLYTMKKYENICKYIHLPAQSGNTRVLELMNRTYTREWYINRVDAIRSILGQECGISSDMIAGFCSETEEEHQDTLSLMDYVKYDFSYMFFYSERPGTLAAKKYADDIPLETKKRRLQEIIAKQQEHSLERNQLDLGKVHKVLIEGTSKRSEEQLQGRNTANKVVIFPKGNHKKGEYVNVLVNDCTAATLFGEVVA
ncbi:MULTISPECIES: tRNA (N6-isopentenyl adenosine(37)-C2)-methylthiotransferase MiaB [Roseivirga]|uniref:tRNA (N6-isopentenyl adenosine(37)-C2)-methylthiotransferase MiaB n=2 Tax=Roseivirgaceae TaxID=2762306 RepID=UPI00257F99F9|nr:MULTISPECIES: tRNA (N6-isopentenyl adenosine(37)-C2)-methylthiotransferase MiaB [Roseivirga]MEC7753433.1 tRNA (N6-isopentenyl adenosine(37)-C2)-methylthiotransferase MiaB [Bacteroidota bacterium]|tara:strand:- start:21502 stop:22971 length:1470 start_codon:yes stop_codon:yes gene_type:complete